MRISVVDLDWLAWLGRYRYATTGQLAEKFAVSDRMVRARVVRLEQMGLVVRYAWMAGSGSVVLPTADGMKVAMVDLPVPDFKHGTVAHELAVVSLGLMWEAHGLNPAGRPRRVGSARLTGWFVVPGDKESLPTLRARFLSLAIRLGLPDVDAGTIRRPNPASSRGPSLRGCTTRAPRTARVVRPERVVDVVQQRAEHVLVGAAVALRAVGGLQGVGQPVDWEAAEVTVQQSQVSQHAIG